jgi:hypothetical protein
LLLEAQGVLANGIHPFERKAALDCIVQTFLLG